MLIQNIQTIIKKFYSARSSLVIFILIQSFLYAEQTTGFREKRYYLEYRYGFPLFQTGGLIDRVNDKNNLVIPAFSRNEDVFIYGYSRSDANRPTIFSRAHSILFEYGLTEKIGIGFNLHSQSYTANNFSFSNYNQNLLLTAFLYGSDGGNPFVLAALNSRYVLLKENAKIMNAGTLDLNLSYHFLSGQKWDPYVRAGLGKGFDLYSNSQITRFLGSIGARYFFTKNLYLVGEIQLAHQEIYKQSKSNFLDSFVPKGVLREVYVQVGIGINPEFKKREEQVSKKEPEKVEVKEEQVSKKEPEKVEVKEEQVSKKEPEKVEGKEEQVSKKEPEKVEAKEEQVSKEESEKPEVKEEKVSSKDTEQLPAKEEKVLEEKAVKKIDSLVPEFKKVAKENGLVLKNRDGKLMISSLSENLFKSGSDKLNSRGEKSFRNLAKVLKKLDGITFTIVGLTDNIPVRNKTKYKTNEELSLGRAESVKAIFISENFPESNLETKGLGNSRPVKSNATAEGRKANRRIEIIMNKNLSEIPELEGLIDEK